MSGATDLIGLIDLSLGERPSGVVNFNYLHCLLHEIVRRLGIFEEQQLVLTGPLSGVNLQGMEPGRVFLRGSTATIPEHGPSEVSLPHGGTGVGLDTPHTTPGHSSSVTTPAHAPSLSRTHSSTVVPATGPAPPTSTSNQSTVGLATNGTTGQVAPATGGTTLPSGHGTTPPTGHGTTPLTGTVPPATGPTPPTGQSSSSIPATSSLPTATGHTPSLPVGGMTQSSSLPHQHQLQSAAAGGDPLHSQLTGEERGMGGGDRSSHASSSDIGGRPPSSGDIHRPVSRMRHHRSSIVSAANDLGYLERKLGDLETRMNAMETLPDLLERKGSDVTATPVRDMWNFTNLNNRVASVETGIDKTSQLVDELLGEVQGLKKQLNGMKETVETRLDGLDSKFAESADEVSKMEDKLKQLEALKLAAAGDGSDAFLGIVSDIQQKVDTLQNESDVAKDKVNELETKMSDMVVSSEFITVRDSLHDLTNTTGSKLTSLESQMEAIKADDSVMNLSTSVDQLATQIKQLESTLSEKVSAADIASLMPSSDGDEAGSLMPKLIELQTKINQLEDKLKQQPSVPSDLMDKVSAMQNAIDHLTTEVNKLSSSVAGSVDAGRLEELASQLAQIRERMEETDRAVEALTTAVSEQGVPMATEDHDNGDTRVALGDFRGLQQLVQGLHQEQERLLGTAANLSHEMEVNQEHIKTLYKAADDLRAMKVDKDQLAMEVDEKADRTALDGKASREWVDSTFERLDREIREAKSHLMGQEEALRNAVGQLNEDVEGKLDRMELEPLKDYIDKNLRKIKTAPIHVERPELLSDDAAGFRKPLRFKCISCDKPLGLKSSDPAPSLPMSDTLPPTRSFRPYTTYELELIRRHQRTQPGILVPPPFPISIRSAGGSHTLTRPQQKIRVTPHSAHSAVVTDNTTRSTPSVLVHDEMSIIGQDGHIYKGRVVKQGLPPISKRKYGRSNRATKVVRPSSTTPLQSIHS